MRSSKWQNRSFALELADEKPRNSLIEYFHKTVSSLPSISVIIATYNRCDLLPAAIESALEQQASDLSYEIIVVDNNSTDDTRRIIDAYERSVPNVQYVLETKQGVSHARNAGIARARAPVVAFFDDDVRVAPNWLAMIKQTFELNPEINCIGGKVLPEWEGEPPLWSSAKHWSPLGLQNHGDEPFYVNSGKPICLISANLAFRKSALAEIGGFAPELQRVKDGIGSMEDHELMTRFYRSGQQGLYQPSMKATTLVPAGRMTKSYHRRWHSGHGAFFAEMRDDDFERSSVRFFDVPGHLYLHGARSSLGMFTSFARGNTSLAFENEVEMRFSLGFISKRIRDARQKQSLSLVREIASAFRQLMKRKTT